MCNGEDKKNDLYNIFDIKRNNCKEKVEKDYNDYVKKVEDNLNEDVKHFWIHINKKGNQMNFLIYDNVNLNSNEKLNRY